MGGTHHGCTSACIFQTRNRPVHLRSLCRRHDAGGPAGRRLSRIHRSAGIVPAGMPDGRSLPVCAGAAAFEFLAAALLPPQQRRPDLRRHSGTAALLHLHAGHQRCGAADLRSLHTAASGPDRLPGPRFHDSGSSDHGGQPGQHGHPGGQSPESLSLRRIQSHGRVLFRRDAAADRNQSGRSYRSCHPGTAPDASGSGPGGGPHPLPQKAGHLSAAVCPGAC